METYSGIQSKASELQATLSGKVQDAKTAIYSAQKAYDAIETAKNDISNALNFSGSVESNTTFS